MKKGLTARSKVFVKVNDKGQLEFFKEKTCTNYLLGISLEGALERKLILDKHFKIEPGEVKQVTIDLDVV